MIRRRHVPWVTKLCYKFICHFIIRCDTFPLNLLAYFHRKVAQTFPSFVSLFTSLPKENKDLKLFFNNSQNIFLYLKLKHHFHKKKIYIERNTKIKKKEHFFISHLPTAFSFICPMKYKCTQSEMPNLKNGDNRKPKSYDSY